MQTLFVANLGTRVTEDDVRAAFEKHVLIDTVQIARDPGSGVSRGVAFVRVQDNKGAAALAVAMTGVEIDGRSIRVSLMSRNH